MHTSRPSWTLVLGSEPGRAAPGGAPSGTLPSLSVTMGVAGQRGSSVGRPVSVTGLCASGPSGANRREGEAEALQDRPAAGPASGLVKV